MTMKKRWLLFLLPLLLLALVKCTSLHDLGNTLNSSTNTIWLTNVPGTITNYSITTNNATNYVTNYTIIYTSTNYLNNTNAYAPLPSSLIVYVDAAPLGGMADPRLNYWADNGSHSGNVTVSSNTTNGGVPWMVYHIPGVDYYQKYELKMRDGSAGSWEIINPGNGGTYKRIVTFPLLTENRITFYALTNVSAMVTNISNFLYNEYSTKDRVFISPPASWYETYAYFWADETNHFRSYSGNIWDDEWFGAEYKGSGRTFFKLYAPNVRKAYVTGDFNGWGKTPMNLDRGRVFWWIELSNTAPGQAYKYVLEQYPNQYGGPYTNYISDPAAKKNEHSPAMNTSGNKSYIIDHSAYSWQYPWSRPGYDWYIIYQMQMRSWWTNGAGSYYGQGTFETAVNNFSYLSNLGFTAIEPLPINEFAGDLSWGYNYVLFYAPESAYVGTTPNTVDSFKYFVDQAHGHGMAVIMDLVFNHMGSSDDVIASYDGAENWTSPDTYWYSGKTDWGPRFNFGNPVVAKFLTQSAQYFMKQYHIDGFRFDATYYIHYNDSGSTGGSYLYNMTRDLRNYAATDGNGANLYLVAENLPTDAWITANNGGNFDSQWNVNMSHHLRNLFKYGPGSIDMNTVASLIYGSDVDNPGNNRSPSGTPALNYLVSHDEAGNGKQRFPAELSYRSWGNGEFDAMYQQITGLATVFMARGIPMLFMGDEFIQGYYPGNNKYFIVEDANTWYLNWENLGWGGINVHNAVKDLIKLRKNNAGIRYTDLETKYANPAKVIEFTRGASDEIFVIINYNAVSYGYPDGGGTYGLHFPSVGWWDLQFISPSGAYGNSYYDPESWTSSVYYNGTQYGIQIPKYGVLIYKKR